MSISDTGVILDPSPTALAEAQQDFIDVFGSDVNLNPASVNGQIIQDNALAYTKRESDQADTVSSLNPDIANGTQLVAIGANLGIGKIPATFSTAPAVLGGAVGTSIIAGSQVQSLTGDIFAVESTAVIGVLGTVNASVVALKSGDILTGANTITKILTGIPGWDTVNNPTAGTVGKPQQSDEDYRKTFKDRLASSSSGGDEAILAAAAALNPTSYYLKTNRTDTPIVVDGITINARSTLLVLDGGSSDEDVANMFLRKISGGANMSGNHSFSVPIFDTPEVFTATWQIAVQKALGINIKLRLGMVYPPDIPTVVANIITNKFNFNVIGRYIEATDFIYLLMQAGIAPIRSLTFNVGTNLNLSEYTMPISDSLGNSLLSSNVSVEYA